MQQVKRLQELAFFVSIPHMAQKQPDPYATLGEFIKRQRELSQLSLRQLADICGISNPYLSQIERGLRTPSSMILQSLAKGLRISAETLYTQAGILDPQEAEESDVIKAVMHDPDLSARQREMMIDMYRSFRQVNETSSTT
ncbi:MAG: helix-turn-helix transcriptional regulator [Desulfurellaceae bacterium]|nr:helix-turn-helix transcriptional regulator [Desulfurellaceae bacterium]